jgi:N-6 DNA Methylase
MSKSDANETAQFIEKLMAAADDLRRKGTSPLSVLFRSASDKKVPLRVINLNSISQIWDEWFVPYLVLLFARELLPRKQPKTILDPAAHNGLFLAFALEATGASGLGLIRETANFEEAKAWGDAFNVRWINGEPRALLGEGAEQYDAVVANLAFGTKKQTETVSHGGVEIEVTDEQERFVLLASALKLAPAGIALFVVSNSFLFSPAEQGVRSALVKFGLKISGCFYLPPGSFEPVTNIGANLIAIEPGKQERMFVGGLSDDDQKIKLLVDNFMAWRSGPELSFGRLVDPSEFRGYPALETQDRLDRMIDEFGAPQVALSTIASEFNRVDSNQEFPERANAVYVPLIGKSPAIADLSEARLKAHNYIQIVLREEKADARYVAGFFSTPLGLMLRQSLESGTVIPKSSKVAWQSAVIFLPNREVQTQTVAAASNIRTAATRFEELQERLWSRPREIGANLAVVDSLVRKETLPEWLDHLPFPVASILWTYHASGPDTKIRYEHLLHFFEAMTEFIATILLSGFSSQHGTFEKDRENLAGALTEAKLSLTFGSFGAWKTILDYFGKRGRLLLDGTPEQVELCKNLFSCSNVNLLGILFSKSLNGVIQETNTNRNLWTGHGGIVSQHTAEERHTALQASLATVRDLFRAYWDQFELVQPRVCRVRNGIFENEVDRLMGPRVPFEVVERKTSIPLETGALYLLPNYEARALRLIPFIKIMPSPKTAQNACYFYNRQQKDNKVRFVSYHFEQEAEVIGDFTDTLDAIRQISGSRNG